MRGRGVPWIGKRRTKEPTQGFQERFLNAVLDSVIDAVIVIDESGKILMANPAAGEMFRYSIDELLGENVSLLMPQPHRAHHDEYMTRYLETGHSGIIGRRREMEARRSNGRPFPMELAVTEIRVGGKRIFVGLIRDLTESKRVDAALTQERERAERLYLELLDREKLATLGGMVAGVAHEVGTPLGTALLAATHGREKSLKLLENLESKAGAKRLAKALPEAFSIIETNLQRAVRMMGSFKEVAVDQATEELRWINISDYLDEVMQALGPRFKHTEHVLHIDCEPDLEIETYPGALSQIITNLVMNSLIHGFENLSAGAMELVVRAGSAAVEFTYRDNGCGIGLEDQDKIFTSMFSTKRGRGGSGLGLQIVYNLVTRLLHGEIEFTSAPGEGVEFSFTVPIRVTAPAPDKL